MELKCEASSNCCRPTLVSMHFIIQVLPANIFMFDTQEDFVCSNMHTMGRPRLQYDIILRSIAYLQTATLPPSPSWNVLAPWLCKSMHAARNNLPALCKILFGRCCTGASS